MRKCHIPHCYYHTHKLRPLKISQETFAFCFVTFTWIQVAASNVPKLKIYDLELSLFFPPTSNSIQQATVELLHFLLFLSTPSSHPPSLRFHSIHSLHWKKVPPGFLALKGQKQTGSWQASSSLGSGYKGEGGERTGQGKGGRKESGGQRKKREGGGQGKVLCGTFFKAHTDNSTCWGWAEICSFE